MTNVLTNEEGTIAVFGSDLIPSDGARLFNQFEAVVDFFKDGEWHTQQSAAEKIKCPQGSVGSQIRNARVLGYQFEKKRVKPYRGLYVYRLVVKPV